MPVPRSVTTIGYYRRLARRPNEPVNAFLIREDKTHGDMIRALQRLLREKELTFEDYDMNLDALKNFCGFRPGASLYFGPEDRSEPGDESDAPAPPERPEPAATDEHTATPRSSRHGRPFTERGPGARPSTTSSKVSTASQEEATVKHGKDVL